MAADKTIQALIKHMEQAVEDFQKGIPRAQKKMLDSLLTELKELQLQDGKILNSVQNLKLIAGLKNKLQRLLIDEGYKEKVKQFMQAFDIVEALQQQYFADFNLKFKPSKTLPIIKEMAVAQTLNDLIGQGLQAEVIDGVHSILVTNSTTGGSYASLTEQLRNHILTNDTGEGSLERHTKTITTDAINQYSAQYHEALALDLNMNWGRYVGSLIRTSREFCERLTKKEWVHRSELPDVIKGHIDGHSCKLAKSTGLPLGMIPGTDVNNFKVRRGGYNCGHQWFWTPDSAVPERIKAKFENREAPKKLPVDLSRLNLDRYLKRVEQPPYAGKFPELTATEKASIHGYTDDEYLELNKFLRGQSPYIDKDEYFSNYANLLNNALEALPNRHEGIVYRGTHLSDDLLKQYENALSSNELVAHNFFTSSTTNAAKQFKGNTTFYIHSKTGKNIQELSYHSIEEEVLFKSGTRFKVVKMTKGTDNRNYITLEEAD